MGPVEPVEREDVGADSRRGPLSGRIALVAGATRGAGRALAVE
ncbi:short-chain dehydrogenase, partial [Streptomyces sp. SID89]|nr:short-chain dehydrogenase [Streptomyces sp. SID89]